MLNLYSASDVTPSLSLGAKAPIEGKKKESTCTHSYSHGNSGSPPMAFFLPPLHRFQRQIRSQFNPNLRRSTFKLHLATGIISGGILRLGCLARWLLSKQRGGNRGQPNLTSTSQLESSSADKRSPEAVGIAAYRKLQP